MNYASVLVNNNLKTRLCAISFHTFAVLAHTKPRLQVIVHGNCMKRNSKVVYYVKYIITF